MNIVHPKGFTLIELLVVIAIIGLLSSVVLASLDSARAKARDARRESDIRQINTAIQLYMNDHNGNPPPPNTGSLICVGIPGSSSCWGTVPGNDSFNAAIQPYIAQIPLDPSTSGDYMTYTYRSPGSYWDPDTGTHTGPVGSYSLSWLPEADIQQHPSECTKQGGIWGAWDQPPGGLHCGPDGHTCRQCGLLVQ